MKTAAISGIRLYAQGGGKNLKIDYTLIPSTWGNTGGRAGA
jgi:hypothetical protein